MQFSRLALGTAISWLVLTLLLTPVLAQDAVEAQTSDTDEAAQIEGDESDDAPANVLSDWVPRDGDPLVAGGIYDKPYLFGVGLGVTMGGYADFQFRFERTDGVNESTFLAERVNIFLFSPIGDRVRFAFELEIEEFGEEIVLETAILDFQLHSALNFRSGVILSPLGRFNLAHDSPAQALVDRPLVSTQILGATLSEVGAGFYGGLYPTEEIRLTYELYVVNGFNDGVIDGDPDGTRIQAGRGTFENLNSVPSVVGRLSFSPSRLVEVGFSSHFGQYNTNMAEDLVIDEARNLLLLAADFSFNWEWLEILAEFGNASIELPASLVEVQAEHQWGLYAEANFRFLQAVFASMPNSYFTAAGRFDIVHLDTSISGDEHLRATVGVAFRPQPETAFKLDYQFNWIEDRVYNLTRSAGILFSATSYF